MNNKSVNTDAHLSEEVESPLSYHYASADFNNVGRQGDPDLYDAHNKSQSLSSLSQYAINDANFSDLNNLDNSYTPAQGFQETT